MMRSRLQRVLVSVLCLALSSAAAAAPPGVLWPDLFGAHGPRIGASAHFTIAQLPPALSFILEATYNNFIGVNVDSDFLKDSVFTRGYSLK